MQLVNSVLLVRSILFIILHSQVNCDDDPPCTNDDLYGKGKMCYFAFLKDINPKVITTTLCADAELFQKGCLHDYTIDFAEISPNSSSLIVTVIPENGKVVWGYTYLMPVDCYQSNLKPDNDQEGDPVIERSQKMKIEVTMDGEKQNIDCNALVAINQPKKESCIPPERQIAQSEIDDMVSTFTAAHFPSDYIDEVRNIPQRFCKCK